MKRYRPKVCSVCGQDWMQGWNHAIWCGAFGRGKPVPLIGPLNVRRRPVAEMAEKAMRENGEQA